MPDATTRLLSPKVAAIASISFLLDYGTIIALRVHSAFVATSALVLAVVAVGLAAGAVAVVLWFESPRLAFFGGIVALRRVPPERVVLA